MHLPIKFCAYIFIQSVVIDSEIKDGGRRRHLGFVGGTMGSPTKAHSRCLPPVKFRHDRLSSFQVIKIWIFVVQAWNSYSGPQNFSFGGFYHQNLWAHRSDPQKALPCADWRVLSPHFMVQIGRTVRLWCDLGKENENRKKKRQWQTGYSHRPPTSPYRSQSFHAGWPPVCSSIFQVLLRSV